MNTILVVDDMAIFREPIAAALRCKGFETLEASSGREALAVVASRRPDLILLDVAMPELDGLGFLKVLRSNIQYQDIPVILLTAVAERDYVLQAAQLGARDYLLKSHFSLAELLDRVARRLQPEAAVSAAVALPSGKAAPAAKTRPSKPAQTSTTAAAATRPTTAGEAVAEPPPDARLLTLSAPSGKSTVQALSQLKPIITRDELLRLVTQGLELRPLAPVVQSVIAVTSSPQCSSEDVAKAVSQDQALCIRILKLANGTVYSRGRSVDNIKDAVARLGSREIRNLVMALGVLEQYDGGTSAFVDAKMFWEHAIACGLFAARLAMAVGYASTDDFLLWGMLHDVGRMVLLEHLPDKAIQVFEAAQALSLPLEQVETKLLMVDHCAILERALEHWRFPREFIIPAVSHHQTPAGLKRLGPTHVRPATIVALANRLAHAALLGSAGNNMIYPIDELIDLLGIERQALDGMDEQVADETANVKISMLARVGDSAWPELASELRNQIPITQALFANPESVCNPYRMVLERMTSTTGERPEAAVVYLPDARKLAQVMAGLEAQEKEAEVANLPTLILCDKGQVDTDGPSLRMRRRMVVKSPARVETLIAALCCLMSE